MTSIVSHLSQSAGGYAKRALKSYVMDELDDFAIFAGIAVEHAVKAKLARKNVLLLSSGTHASIAGLLRSAGRIDRLPPNTPTIGGSKVIELYGQLEPSLTVVVSRADELVRIRNGQAHLAVNDETQIHRVLVVFLQAVEALLEIDPDMFWEPYQDFVKTRLDESSRAIDRHVQQLIVAARVRREQIPNDQFELLQLVAATTTSAAVDNMNTYTISCFVCGSQAMAYGTTQEDDWEVDYDDGVPTGAYPILGFHADGMRCDVCGIELESREELEAAGLDVHWENEDLDLDTWLQETYGPDDWDSS